ncbi:MAG TPA: FMN-binding protein [Micromonosporaceae bacterium]|nr:FMN-binding protein [Micromonosporaceae bacterium]
MWILSTITGLALLFSYRTSTMGQSGAGGDTVAGATGGGTTSAGSSGSGSAGDGTYNGSVAQTRWGPVQVRIVVAGGRITSVTTLQVPNGNSRDQQINARAVPILNREAVAAQSAQIDTVSGATVTSDGYRTSLQAAIDAAHL